MDNSQYRDILISELERRKRLNPRYSMRSFARDLGVVVSQLSCVLSGQEGLSAAKARQVARRLDLSSHETEVFLNSVSSLHSRSAKIKKEAQIRLGKIALKAKVTLSHFSVISDWYHFAILEYLTLPRVKKDSVSIASAFAIKPGLVEDSLKKMSHLGLIKFSRGTPKAAEPSTSTPTDVPSRFVRQFHAEQMQKAKESLEKDQVDFRNFLSVTLAFDSSDIQGVKVAMQQFRETVTAISNRSAKKDSVYAFNMQFFPLTREFEKGEKE